MTPTPAVDFDALPFEVEQPDDEQTTAETAAAKPKREDPANVGPTDPADPAEDLGWLPWLILAVLGGLLGFFLASVLWDLLAPHVHALGTALKNFPAVVATRLTALQTALTPAPFVTQGVQPQVTATVRELCLSAPGVVVAALLGGVGALVADRWVGQLQSFSASAKQTGDTENSGPESALSEGTPSMDSDGTDDTDSDRVRADSRSTTTSPASRSNKPTGSTQTEESRVLRDTGGDIHQDSTETESDEAIATETTQPTNQLDTPRLDLRQFDEVDVERGLDHLVGSFTGPPQGHGPGEVVVSDLTPDNLSELTELVDRMSERKLSPALEPILLGVPDCTPAQLDAVVDAYEATVFVEDQYRWMLLDLLEIVPEVTSYADQGKLNGVGSASLRRIPLDELRRQEPDPVRRKSIIINELTEFRGRLLHPYAEDLRESGPAPLVAVATPRRHEDLVRQAFAETDAEVVVGAVDGKDELSVVRFYLEGSLTPKRFHSTETVPGWDSMPSPTNPSTGSMPPGKVAITQDVLDEMAAHALSDTEREVYGLIYAKDGCIQKFYPVQSEEHVLRQPKQVTFTADFQEHVGRLAGLYDELGFRLAGDCHSHPVSGNPTPSDADIESFKRFWSNDRNTYFIIGLDEGSAPDEWTVVDDGHEARRVIDNQQIRIKAYGVNGQSKELVFPEAASQPESESEPT